MTGWVILVDQPKDFPNADTPHKVITTSEYLARPRLFDMGRPAGQPAAFLRLPVERLLRVAAGGGARPPGGARTSKPCWSCARPSSTSMRCPSPRTSPTAAPAAPTSSRKARSSSWSASASPATRASIVRSAAVRLVPLPGAGGDRRARPVAVHRPHPPAQHHPPGQRRGRVPARRAAPAHQREWRDPKARSVAEYDLAVLHDPNEKMPPSSPASIKHMARIAEKLSVDVEPITRRQLAELAEYDGLFIRETTSIDNHTYRFARRAWQEGMPVIDDPISMIRCTNKVFLMELLGQNQVAMPPTVILADDRPAEGHGRARPAAGGENPRRLVLARRAQGRARRRSSGASPTSCSRRPTSCWRRNSCRPSSTGASACWRASRCSSASTAWRAATGRSSSTAPTAPRARAASGPSISTRRRPR